MKIVVAFLMTFSSLSFAQEGEVAKPAIAAPTEAIAPTADQVLQAPKNSPNASASTSTKLILPESTGRNTVIFGGGAAGALVGYAIGQADNRDNSARTIATTFLGATAGFAIGSFVGLKLYPPVLAPTADGKGTSAYFTVQF